MMSYETAYYEDAPGIPKDVFALLYRYLKEQRTRAIETFRKFDRNKNGTLDIREITLLVQTLIPGTTVADVEYFLAMIDADADSSISYKELHKACEECYIHSVAVRREEPAARAAIAKLKDLLKKYNFDAIKAFKRFDRDNSGYLDYSELVKMLREVMPSLTLSELRYITANLKLLDVNGDGRITFEELQNALEPEWLKLQNAEYAEQQRRMRQEAELRAREMALRERERLRQEEERRAWAERQRLLAEEEARRIREEEARIRKLESGRRKWEIDIRLREAEVVALEVMKERDLAKERREAEQEALERSKAEEEYLNRKRKEEQIRLRNKLQEEERRALEDEEERARRMEQQLENQFQHRRPHNLAYVNLVDYTESSNPLYAGDGVRGSTSARSVRSLRSSSALERALSLSLTDPRPLAEYDPDRDVWTNVQVVDQEPLPASRFTKLPDTKRYEYYKYYGFAGRGATTSWGHNPSKPPKKYHYRSKLREAGLL